MPTLKEALKNHNETFSDLIANLELSLEKGVIDEDEFEQYVIEARNDLQERIDAELGIESDEDEDAEYSNDGDYAEFSVGSQYGQALLELGAEAYYDEESDEYDIEGLCHELAALSGEDANDIYGVLTGEIDPSDEFSLTLAEALELDEETESQLLILGIETRGESIEDYLDDEDEEDSDEEEYEDDEEDAEYSRVAQLEEEMANFKSAEIVKDQLSHLEARAWALVDNGQIAPVVVEKLLGNFNSESDRVAAFSSVAQSNGVTAGQELYAMAKVIEVLETMPVVANFGFESLQEVSDEELAEEQEVNNLAAAIIKNRKRN